MAHRVVVKAGTGVVTDARGYPSLHRLGAIVEQCAWLKRHGKEVILVSSGAMGIGRQMLKKQSMLNTSMGKVLDGLDTLTLMKEGSGRQGVRSYDSSCAAAGQLGLMSLYDTLFSQCDVATSQILVTEFDFRTPARRRNLRHTISTMLKMGIIPILNENDAVSGNEGYDDGGHFSDNDGLAALVAEQLNCQLMILLTDVEGVYDRHPSMPEAKVVHTFTGATRIEIGAKSASGRGGMEAKIKAARRAVGGGVTSVVIASGHNPHSIENVLSGQKVGTLFCVNAPDLEALDEAEELQEEQEKQSATEALMASPMSLLAQPTPPTAPAAAALGSMTASASLAAAAADDQAQSKETEEMRAQAEAARAGGRALCAMTSDERSDVLRAVAEKLLARQDEILQANAKDLAAAKANNLEAPLLNRLALTPTKLATLAEGISSLADTDEPLERCISNLEVSKGLVLKQVTVPIGVLLIIFESRPDSLPQIASLALRSGNGLLLKGGKEAVNSNRALHGIIVDAVHEASKGRVPRSAIGLITTRSAIGALLKLDDVIDLVIPRGSGALVTSIKEGTKIPVMGHAEGICHVYIDKDADSEKAAAITVDSKTNYPAACNACETILIHESLLGGELMSNLLTRLNLAGVQLNGGPRALSFGLVPSLGSADPTSFKTEYGDFGVSLEVVGSAEEAIAHIHKFGSGHTEAIVTEDQAAADHFLQTVDAACVFHNASTRFSDGFRFGLGAEVGISTGRIHARGPVGVEGLLTTKWVLRSDSCHTVDGMGKTEGHTYTHHKLELENGI